MVQILPEAESFGTQIARNLGGGISQGLGQAAQFAQQMGMEKYKTEQRKKLIEDIERPQSSYQDLVGEFKENLPLVENQLGRKLTPDETDQLWTKFTESTTDRQPKQQKQNYHDLAKRAAIAGEHDLSRAYSARAKSEEKKEAEERAISGESAKEFWSILGKERDKLPALQTSLDAQLNAVMRGDVDPWSKGHIADIAKALGAPSSLVAPLETPGSKEFKTGLKTYLSSTLKDAFRGTTTGREIELAEGLLAQAGVTKEGNLASLWLLQSQSMLTKEKIRLAKELKKQGVSAYDIPDEVSDQLEPYRKFLSEQYTQAIEELSKK